MAKRAARVLVVHGAGDTAKVTERALRRSGFEPILTDDPERAAWIAAELTPVAAVLDLTIARFDVLDLAGVFRGHPRTCGLAIVALAEDAATDAVEYAIARGCDAALALEGATDALGAEVERLVAKRGRRAA